MTTDDKGPYILGKSSSLYRLNARLTLPNLVSGANRGIGLHLIHALLNRLPDATIFAGARDPSTADALNDLAVKNGKVHVVKLVVDDEQSNREAIEKVKKVTKRLDIVVANAGQSYRYQNSVRLVAEISKHRRQLPFRPDSRHRPQTLQIQF